MTDERVSPGDRTAHETAGEGAAARHARLMDLFDEACDLDAAGRAEVVARVRGADGALADELVALLAYDPVPGAVPAADGADPGALGGLAVTRDGAMGAVALGMALFGDWQGRKHSLPEQIGNYRIVKILGEGGMGMVLEAEQTTPRRRVALKLLRAELATTRMRRRFRAEAEILARLSHPGIARVFEAGVEPPHPFLVMELVDGHSLGVWSELTTPDLKTRVEVLAKVADAVDHAHRNGVVHRDLKPANILVDKSGEPKVLDFGIARVTVPGVDSKDGATPTPHEAPHETPHVTATPPTAMTHAGEVVGTPAYMSPEQTRLDPAAVDHRTDVYALGVVAYELLTGQMPYPIDRADIVVNFTRIREHVPTAAGKLRRELAGDLEVILAKALEKAPERRYTSAAALADDLRRWLRSEPVLARPPSTLYQLARFARRNRALVLASVALFVVLVAGVVTATALYLEARAIQAELRRRVDELVLLQARATLAADPTAAVGWLDGLSPEAPWDRAFALAWEARGRGVSERTLSGHEADVEWVDVSPPGPPNPAGPLGRPPYIASASFDGTVRVVQLDHDASATVLRGHDGGVNRVVWSPDGLRLASAGRDGTVRVWSRAGAPVVTFRAHAGESEDVAWSPDGLTVVSGGADGVLWLGDPATGRGRALLTAGDSIKDVAWQGGYIVAAGDDGVVHVWDVARGAASALTGHRDGVDHVAFAPEAAGGGMPRIASGASDGEVRIWDPDGAVKSFESPSRSGVKGLVFVARGLVAAVDRAGALRLWDLATGAARELTTTGSVYRDVQVSPDGAWLATASDDRTVGLWDARTFEPMVLRGHRDAALHVAFTPDSRRLVSSGKDGDVRVWRLPERRTRWSLGTWPRAVASAGDVLAVIDDAGGLLRADLASGRLDGIADGENALVLGWSPDGARLVTASRSGRARVWSRSGQLEREVELGDRPNRVAFAADGTTWAAALSEGRIAFVGDAATSIDVAGDRAEDIAFVASDRLITGHRDGRVCVTPRTGAATTLVDLEGAVYAVRARPGWAAAGSQDGRVLRWAVSDAGEPSPAGEVVHAAPILGLALGADGVVAAGDRHGVIKVATTGGDVVTLAGHSGAVTTLAWAGGALVSGGEDRTVRVWDVAARTASVVDVFDGPITQIATVGADAEHVVVIADQPALGLWPIDVPRDEARVRAFIAAIIQDGRRESR